MHNVITEHFLLKKPDLILTKFIPGLYNNRKALLISYSKLKKYSVKKRKYVSKQQYSLNMCLNQEEIYWGVFWFGWFEHISHH